MIDIPKRRRRKKGNGFIILLSLQFKAVVKANFEHAKWAHAAHLPSFEEYMEAAELEITVCAVLGGCFMSLGKMATKEAYEWLKSRPRLVKSLCVRCRLMNDIYGLEVRILIISLFMTCSLSHNISKTSFRKT